MSCDTIAYRRFARIDERLARALLVLAVAVAGIPACQDATDKVNPQGGWWGAVLMLIIGGCFFIFRADRFRSIASSARNS